MANNNEKDLARIKRMETNSQNGGRGTGKSPRKFGPAVGHTGRKNGRKGGFKS
ncbi:MAG: hypothetical protein V3W09_04380 [Nitrososphaerales archaeon]